MGCSRPWKTSSTLTSRLNTGMNEPNRRGRRRQVWTLPSFVFPKWHECSVLTHPSRFYPLPRLLWKKHIREEEGEEKNEVNCKIPRLSAAPSSPPLLFATTTTAGGSHARRCSVAFTGHTGSSLSACWPVALTGRRTGQQVGARGIVFVSHRQDFCLFFKKHILAKKN